MARLIFVLFLIGCAKDESSTQSSFVCPIVPDDLIGLEVGLDVSDHKAFNLSMPVRYHSGPNCFDLYEFIGFEDDEDNYCYKITVNVDCFSRQITSIYKEGL